MDKSDKDILDNTQSLDSLISSSNDEDILLYEAYEEYASQWDESNKSEKEMLLWSKIKTLTNDNLLRYFLFCQHYYKYERNLDEVIYNIEKAVVRRESNISIFIGNSFNKEMQLLESIERQIYQIAGEVYAIKENYDKSLEFYQKYHYVQSFLKSEFEENEIKLFSFRKLNKYSLADLINKTITVCHPSLMNDPFDSLFALWSKPDNLNLSCSEKTHIQPYSKSFDYFRIRSFSSCSPKNVLMWSHYGDEHRGFCVQYRLSKHFIKEEENDLNKHMYLKKIEYTKNKISVEVNTLNSTLGFATKYRDWKYEKEVRLISYNPQVEGKFHSISLDSDSGIGAIYFGYRCDENDIKTIMNICSERYKGIKFYKMELNPTNIYKLTLKRIRFSS